MSHVNVGFRDRAHFVPPKDYRLAPFRFDRLDASRYIATNDVGEFVVLTRDELDDFVHRRMDTLSDTYRALKARHFIFDDTSESALDLLSLKMRTRSATVANFTALHIFVVTLRCDHSCHYCQVSRQTEDKAAYDMSEQHAERALAMTFRSPASRIKIEFQGGEPLLAFERIQHVVRRATELNRTHQKTLDFVIASNLSRLTDEMLAFFNQHRVYLSTSLDGPEDLHNAHRPLRDGNSYQRTVEGIRRVRGTLGSEFVSAVMTTTPASLTRVQEIIDEYVHLGFESIFLRSLSPYGFAVRTNLLRRYDVEDWLRFFRLGLDYILELNRRGRRFREEYTSIILEKIFRPSGTSYVDLQSPAGIGIGAIVYNYDGAVYASDEGRMLAEMGDESFRLGHLDSDSYDTMMTSEALLGPLEDTLLESSPMCSECAFLPYCGADPVFHRATMGDVVGHKAFSAFCQKQMGVVRYILTLLENDADARILKDWI